MRLERAFPLVLRGPVDLAALRRLAWIFLSDTFVVETVMAVTFLGSG